MDRLNTALADAKQQGAAVGDGKLTRYVVEVLPQTTTRELLAQLVNHSQGSVFDIAPDDIVQANAIKREILHRTGDL